MTPVKDRNGVVIVLKSQLSREGKGKRNSCEVKERRERGGIEGRRPSGRQGQDWSADREATEGGKIPALGKSQRFGDLDVCESGVRPVGSLTQRLRGDGYESQARLEQGF